MEKSLACMENYDSFFSYFQRRKARGIHGTAIITKRASCVPLKAEEGLSNCLVSSDLTDKERIGGYPTVEETDLDYATMKDLDLEGRTTVCDFGLFVLINL